METMKVGDSFSSWDAFFCELEKFKDLKYHPLVKYSSRTAAKANEDLQKSGRNAKLYPTDKFQYTYCEFRCTHRGEYKSKSLGLKTCKSFKSGCKARVYASVDKEKETVVLKKLDVEHNHPIGPELYAHYPKVRLLTKDEEQDVAALAKLKVSTKMLKEHVTAKFGKSVKLMDIRNVRKRAGIEVRQPSSQSADGLLHDAQLLVSCLIQESERDQGATGQVAMSETYELRNSGVMASVLPKEISSRTVSELQQLDFSSLSLDEKVVVKVKGRPTPDIQITQPGVSNNKMYIRSFDSEWYQRKDWLCGCEIRSALFCFPCLLFGGDATWTKDGFRNINKMKEKMEKHEKSMKHIESVVSLSLLEGVDVKEKLSKAYRDSVIEVNRKITKNRDILSKIIDCMTFSGNFETSMRDYDRINRHDSINSDVFRGLLNFASKLDPDLKNHLETSSVFNGVSKTIHNEILHCLLQIYREEIKLEIGEALFLAIMVDDVIEFSERTQMVIVLRYVLKEEIIERFWGFFLPEDQTADGISKCILEQLDLILHGYRQKLVVQTIDGPNFMKGIKGEVQAKIKAVYENAHFIHCYAHPLSQIIRNAASVTRGSRIFFSNILAIPTFFSRSPQCVSIFNKHINSSVSHPSSEIWMNFTTRTVDEVHKNLQPLKCCLTEIQSTSNKDQTISEATGILHCLNDKEFVFWLELFRQIIPRVEEIYNEMQSPHIDAFKVHEYVYIFKTAIYIIKNSMYCENQSKILVSEAKEFCDCLCVDLVERYSSFTKHLVAAGLLNKKDFTSLEMKFPSEDIELTVEGYPMIDKEKLERELKVFYSRMELHEHGRLIDLLKFIMENNIDGVLSEIVKLIKILLTIPVTTSEPERCFSTLQRIKTFLRTTTTNEEKLDALAMISIENNFFDSHPNLKEKVIDLFAQHETRRMDFVLK